jgi:hypothetical protein
MKKNCLLMAPLFPSTLGEYAEEFQGVYVSSNFEQVLGMVQEGEVERLAIIMGATFSSFSSYHGQQMAERVHSEYPDLPILVYGGRSRMASDRLWSPIVFPNETYFRMEDYPIEDATEIIHKFFLNGEMNLSLYATYTFDNAYVNEYG